MMKTNLLGMALICLGLCACSNDDDTPFTPSSGNADIYGIWECIEGEPPLSDNSRISEGTLFKFLNSEEYYSSFFNRNLGKKCFVDKRSGYWYRLFLFSNQTDEEYSFTDYTPDPTEAEWHTYYFYDNDGLLYDEEPDPTYFFTGDSLSILDPGSDRWAGTVTIAGDIMTFNYKYQDWDSKSNVMISESRPYVAKLKRVEDLSYFPVTDIPTDSLLGTWVFQNGPRNDGTLGGHRAFSDGTNIKFFNNGKCFIPDNIDIYFNNDVTEETWTDNDEKYVLKRDSLTIIRDNLYYTGRIRLSPNSDIVYIYKTQYRDRETNQINSESARTFYSILRRKTSNNY